MDLPIRSPWLHQLNRKRPTTPLERDIKTDIAIIGGGIAGIATAYFLLHDTDKTVVLLEADKVAHGATGHNAGQLVAEFERSFSSIARQFGLAMASEGYKSIQSAWSLLEQMQRDMSLKTPSWRMTGYGGLSDTAQILDYLADALLRAQGGLPLQNIMIAAEWEPGFHIPLTYEGLYTWVPQDQILELLESKDKRYLGLVEAGQRGCMNSALFCEEMIQAMLTRWPDRLSLYEMTPVRRLTLQENDTVVQTGSRHVVAGQTILCTNGFENITIINDHGGDIDIKFHAEIRGQVGYMAAFLEPQDKPPMANWYQDKPGVDPDQPYYYMTRRPYDMEGATNSQNLLSVGGPEALLPETASYSRSHSYHDPTQKEIDAFMRRTYVHYDPKRTENAFFWHGLMGYTRDGLRLIGVEPCNNRLLYNLGCNGIGLLHSIYGGYKIGQIVSGAPQTPSIFDPRDKTCVIPRLQ